MDKQTLSPVAEMVIDSYLDAGAYSRSFRDEHGEPPNNMAKVMHLRSVLQTSLQRSDRYELDQQYRDHGKVEFFDLEDQRTYLLRSSRAVSIDGATGHIKQGTLFDSSSFETSDTTLLISEFDKVGLTFAVARTKQVNGRRRLEMLGSPVPVAKWHYQDADGATFDQGSNDAFVELGNVEVDAEGLSG